MWQVNLGQPATIGDDACFAAAVWTGTQLLLSGSGSTTIGGITYDGSVRSVDRATGAVRWQTGIPAAVFGSPTEDGAGLIAVSGYSSSTRTRDFSTGCTVRCGDVDYSKFAKCESFRSRTSCRRLAHPLRLAIAPSAARE